MLQTAIVVVDPEKANKVLAELSQAKAEVVSVQPIYMGAIDGREDILVTFRVESEQDDDAQFAFLSWLLEETVGSNCKIY